MGLVGYTVSNLENGLGYGINSLDPDEVIPYQTSKTVLGAVSSAVISFREYRINPQKTSLVRYQPSTYLHNPQTKGCPQRTAYEFKLFNRLFCDIFAVSFLDDVPVEFESGHVLCKSGFGSILVVCRDRICNSLVI